MALTIDQLSAITRTKYIPKMVDNIFDSNPFFERMKNKNLMKLDGGLNIQMPLLYAATSSSGFYEGADKLNTADNEQLSAAKYDWKFHYANIVLKNTDLLKNNGADGVLNLLKEKVMASELTAQDDLGTAFWNDGSASKNMHGLRFLISASNTVGGISQTDNSWWQANLDSTTTTLTLSAMQTQYNAASIGNDKPSVGFTTRSIYNSYWNLLQPQQRFADARTSGNAGFSSLLFNSMPLIVDSHCPANHMAFINEKYLKFVAHSKELLRFEDFKEPIDQRVKVAKIYTAGNLASNNNRMHVLFSAITA